MRFISYTAKEPLVLEPDDWTEAEWKTLLKLFGMKEAEVIMVHDYTMRSYGTPTDNLSKCVEGEGEGK